MICCLNVKAIRRPLIRCTAFLVLSMGVTPMVPSAAAVESAKHTADTLDESKELIAINTKTTSPTCNQEGYYCVGTYSTLIEHMFTSNDGEVRLRLTQPVIDAINTASFCPLKSEVFVILPVDGDSGEDNILKQLYISYLKKGALTLRFGIGTSGYCEIAYIRALYGTE